MAKTVDSNSFETVKNNKLSNAGVYWYSGRMIGFPDLKPDKLYPVLRPPEELEKAASTFEGVPFIIDHEMLGKDATPYDARPASGTVINVHYKDGSIWGDLKIWSERMKQKIFDGIKELSLGYKSTYERKMGKWNGQIYEFIQKNLRGNHLALVKNGRMGSDVRVMDKSELEFANTFDSVEFDITNKEIEKGNNIMKKNEEGKQTSDEFVSVEKLYEKFPDAKEWIDENKYKRASSDGDEGGEDEGETKVVKSDESKTGFVTKKTSDEDVDKRKLIDEVGGILKDKVSEEIWRTVIGKIEKASYNKSSTGGSDDGDEGGEGEGKKKEVEKQKGEGTKDGCGMDAAELRKSVISELRQMDKLYSQVKEYSGEFTYDSLESVEELASEACKRLKIEANGNSVATLNGYLSAMKAMPKTKYTFDSGEKTYAHKNVKSEAQKRLESLLS